MVRRENEKSVDSRFLKIVWEIRSLRTRGWPSLMDIKLEQFLQKSGFANMHISKKVHLGFSSNLQKITSIYGLYNFPFVEKLNFASFQNGGFAPNGHKKLVI
jgi:hypothetical protein